MIVSLRLNAPLSHGSFGESAGNATLFRRMTVVSLPGMPRIPVVSGNALRGVMRRLLMRELFASVGIDRRTVNVIVEQSYGEAWDRLYAAMANGGHLEASEATVKPDEMRALREACPPLSVLGAAMYSFLLPGHVDVGICWPVCVETVAAGLVDGDYANDDVHGAEELVEEISQVRHIDREQQDPEASGVTPMPTTVETLSTGTVLQSRIHFARHATDVERGAIAHALDLITSLGGKHSSGFGQVTVMHDGPQSGTYRQWLADKERVIDGLRVVAKRIGCGKPEKPAGDKAPKKGRGKKAEVLAAAASEEPTP